MVAPIWNLSIQEAEAGGLPPGQPGLYNELQASLGYSVRL